MMDNDEPKDRASDNPGPRDLQRRSIGGRSHSRGASATAPHGSLASRAEFIRATAEAAAHRRAGRGA